MIGGLATWIVALGCTGGPATDSASTPAPPVVDTGEFLQDPLIQLAGDRPRNLLVISIDTLRRDRVGFTGGTDLTPGLDALAAEGFALQDHHACANWTFPSVLCAQTGRTSLQLGFHPEPGDASEPYPGTYPTLDVMLLEAGFHTALVTTNVFLRPLSGTASGFEVFELMGYDAPEDVAAAALSQLSEAVGDDRPFYQHVHFLDPHSPYGAPSEWWGDTSHLAPLAWDFTTEAGIDEMLKAWAELDGAEQGNVKGWVDVLYDAEIKRMDAAIADLFTEARALGALEDTLVVVWSDHGEQFWEDGRFGHARATHDEELDAIGLFWMEAGGVVAGETHRPTANVDLVPTVLDLLGLPEAEHAKGSIVGTPPFDRRRVGVHFSPTDTQLSMERKGWKLVVDWDGDAALYDRSTDRGEEVDRLADEPALASELWGYLRPRFEDLQDLHPGLQDFTEPGL